MNDTISQKQTFLTRMEKWPYVKAVLLTGVMLAILVLGVQMGNAMDVSMAVSSTLARVVAVSLMVYLLIHANIFSLFNDWSFNLRKILSMLVLAVPIATAIAMVGLSMSGDPTDINQVAFYLFNMQMVGIYEEFMFRALIFAGFVYVYMKQGRDNPVMLAIAVVVFAFGIMHIINLFTGKPVVDTIAQIIMASLVTYAFCALVLITRNIWVAGILHGLFNSTSVTTLLDGTGLGENINGAIVAIVFSGVLYFILKSDDGDDFMADLKSLTQK